MFACGSTLVTTSSKNFGLSSDISFKLKNTFAPPSKRAGCTYTMSFPMLIVPFNRSLIRNLHYPAGGAGASWVMLVLAGLGETLRLWVVLPGSSQGRQTLGRFRSLCQKPVELWGGKQESLYQISIGKFLHWVNKATTLESKWAVTRYVSTYCFIFSPWSSKRLGVKTKVLLTSLVTLVEVTRGAIYQALENLTAFHQWLKYLAAIWMDNKFYL